MTKLELTNRLADIKSELKRAEGEFANTVISIRVQLNDLIEKISQTGIES